MERAKHHVARFSGGDRRLDRLQVAKLADEDDVGVLSQRAAEGLREARHVGADLPLVDRALLRLVIKLDRILDRDDVVIVGFVDEVDQARERGAFARAGGARHEKQATRPLGHLLADFRYTQLLRSEHLVGDLPEHHGDRALLLEHAHAETGQVFEGEAEVAATLFGQLRLASLGRDRFHQAVGVVGGEHLGVLGRHGAAHAKHGGQAHRDVDVAHASLHGRRQKLVDLDRAHRLLGHREGIMVAVAASLMPGLRLLGDVELDVASPGRCHCRCRDRDLGGRSGPRIPCDTKHQHLRALDFDQGARVRSHRSRKRKHLGVGTGRHDCGGIRLHVFGSERLCFQRPHLVAESQHRRIPAREPNFRGAVFLRQLKEPLDLGLVWGCRRAHVVAVVPMTVMKPSRRDAARNLRNLDREPREATWGA